jgi:hypothetical protein
MTDRAKFEQMLEYLINEDKSKAEELFHELVVAKSREIYENLLDDDLQFDQPAEEAFGLEAADDPADDLLGDIEADDEEPMDGADFNDEGGDEEPATVGHLDLMKQDIIDALTAEFEQMMGGDKGDSEEEFPAGGAEEGPAEPEAEEEPMDDEETKEDFVMEYVEKVSAPKHGDNGANTKSPLAKANNMGGTTANIAKGGESNKGGTQGGLLNPSTKDLNSGNVNTPGSKSATKLSSVAKGHGAEKKGAGESGAATKSIIGSKG